MQNIQKRILSRWYNPFWYPFLYSFLTKENLTFTVCLVYMYEGVEDMVEERKKIDVGKPLVAKLDIHAGFRSPCAQSSHLPHSPCHNPDYASAGQDSSRVFSNPRFPQSPHNVYRSHLRRSIPPESYHQDLYSAFPSSNRRYFSENKSLYSNVTITSQRNIPEESTEENFGYQYKQWKRLLKLCILFLYLNLSCQYSVWG